MEDQRYDDIAGLLESEEKHQLDHGINGNWSEDLFFRKDVLQPSWQRTEQKYPNMENFYSKVVKAGVKGDTLQEIRLPEILSNVDVANISEEKETVVLKGLA